MAEVAHPRRTIATAADVPFVVLAVVSGAVLLYLGRSFTFWFDEWRWITFEGTTLDYFRPSNEHWTTLPLILYRATFGLVELHSYLPYLAEVIVLHLAAVSGAYVLMRRRAGPLIATVFCVPLLLLGAGAENLYWAYQTGFVGSVMFGMWALALVERPGSRSPWLAAVCLLGGVMCSGIGLCFVVVTLCLTALEAPLRRRSLAPLAAMALYLVWYLLLGDEAVDRAGVSDFPEVARFVARGVGHAAEALIGLDNLPTGSMLGVVLVGVLCIFAARQALSTPRRSLGIACVAGLVAMYGLIGLVRVQFGDDFATRSRYVYVAAFLLVLCLVDLLPRAGYRQASRTGRAAVGAGLTLALAAWLIAANVDALLRAREPFQYRADLTRSIVDIALRYQGASWVDGSVRFNDMPSVRELPSLVARHGSPLRDRFFPSVVPPPTARAREGARLIVVGDRLRVLDHTPG